MDLTAEEVNDMILQEKMRVADKPKAENLDDGLSDEDNATPDPEDEDEDVVVEIPKDTYAATLANAEKIVADGPPAEGLAPSATTRYNEAVKLVEQLSTAENVQQEIDRVQAELDKSRTGPQPNAKKKIQKDLMAKIAELEIRLKSFSGLKQGG